MTKDYSYKFIKPTDKEPKELIQGRISKKISEPIRAMLKDTGDTWNDFIARCFLRHLNDVGIKIEDPQTQRLKKVLR